MTGEVLGWLGNRRTVDADGLGRAGEASGVPRGGTAPHERAETEGRKDPAGLSRKNCESSPFLKSKGRGRGVSPGTGASQQGMVRP